MKTAGAYDLAGSRNIYCTHAHTIAVISACVSLGKKSHVVVVKGFTRSRQNLATAMAFSAVRSISGAACRLLIQTRPSNVSATTFKSLLNSSHQSQTYRAFARSMWYMSGSNRKCSGSTIEDVHRASVKLNGWPQRCACCGLHTEGDKELSKYLQNEINLEKDSHNDLPKLPGFEVSMDGSEGILTKLMDGEQITIKFNVNHSVEFEASGEGDEDGKMQSYPNFEVTIVKSGKPKISMSCRFINDEMDNDEAQQEESGEDYFLIDEVVISNDKVTEKTYVMGSEVMAGELYDMLMNMLSERGIDNDLVEKISVFASSMEHTLYIQFLEKLKNITSS
ncbi:complement component 1 Q subcomponent-binding protein, mitochondrial-like [Saccoglossus kowalevskii]|uniref:Complement component 1 Q subcomponent-binding protein, mitochondrial-like n=1 Tax=Saccoglossus kowalevskii TaxID=10224 RepID=A0ABM0GUH0_SACKO|nr:PREDICTED: complement component 1 Q subcomponent-binding protein, mitochondrial-like [Saccoglossus kowalevskii]